MEQISTVTRCPPPEVDFQDVVAKVSHVYKISDVSRLSDARKGVDVRDQKRSFMLI